MVAKSQSPFQAVAISGTETLIPITTVEIKTDFCLTYQLGKLTLFIIFIIELTHYLNSTKHDSPS